VSFALLQRRFDCHLPGVHAERLPWGFVPRRDVSYRSPLPTGFPGPALTFRPRRFSRPRRFPPPLALRICFIPQPRPGFSLQGFPPTSQVAPTRRRRFPPRRWHRDPAFLRWRRSPGTSTSWCVLTSDPQWPARVLAPPSIRVPSCEFDSFGLPCPRP